MFNNHNNFWLVNSSKYAALTAFRKLVVEYVSDYFSGNKHKLINDQLEKQK